MIKEHLGKILVIGNFVVLILLIYATFTNSISMDVDILVVTQVGLAITSFMVLMFVLQTWKTFKEKDLFVGLAGFLLIFISYSLVALFVMIKGGGSEVEAGINVMITFGYLLITIAAGWLK